MDKNQTIQPELKQYSQEFFLTAGECNPEGELPLPLLVTRVIEVATGHANAWGVGYDRLVRDNQGWVLTRVTIEMKRYPRVNERYSLTTWIEDYNRHFSQRNMEVRDKDDEVIGYVRTIWMVINFTTRESVDISKLSYIAANVLDRPCPIEPQRRLAPFTPASRSSHRFTYTDCDFNRHVNTVRYVELLLNHFSLEHFDRYSVARFEIAFVQESHYDETADVVADDSNPLDCRLDINVDSKTHVRARIAFAEREH